VRRLFLIISAGCIGLSLVATTALTAAAETSEQQRLSKQPQNTNTYDVEAQASFISQGSAVGASSAELAALRADVAEEESLPDYSQVVDNGTGGRFSAPGWQKHRDVSGVTEGQVSHGGSFVESGSGGQPARFKVKIPTSNDYTVYAWWPAFSGSSKDAHFGIDTAAGRRWTSVDQTLDGGIWIKLGTYAMKKGERTIQLSAGDSVADAVAVVRGDVTMPPDDGAGSGGATYSASSVSDDPTRHDVVRVAKRWITTPYKYATCTKAQMSCTCETKKTYRRFGHYLSMDEREQWRYDEGAREVRREYNLMQGDEVFFKEHGRSNPITHVAIYSGNGYVVHASVYFGKVVESEMKWISGYYGAKRYRLH
jgi:NlpC/P60 family